MLYIRSLAFNIAFYLNLVVQMIVWTPYYFLAERRKAWLVPKFWVKSSLWLYSKLARARVSFTGMENLPQGSYILAPKHQSFLDTIAFLPLIPDALFILKRELTWIPLFGWYVIKMRMIPINRSLRSMALKTAVMATEAELARNDRQLIIYPEGTRRSPGDAPAYKWGIAEIYRNLNVPVVPVAHVAGLYWPRRRFLRYPGTIEARFLAPILPGLSKEEFMARLIAETETACDELLVAAAAAPDAPQLPETAVRRLRELGVGA